MLQRSGKCRLSGQIGIFSHGEQEAVRQKSQRTFLFPDPLQLHLIPAIGADKCQVVDPLYGILHCLHSCRRKKNRLLFVEAPEEISIRLIQYQHMKIRVMMFKVRLSPDRMIQEKIVLGTVYVFVQIVDFVLHLNRECAGLYPDHRLKMLSLKLYDLARIVFFLIEIKNPLSPAFQSCSELFRKDREYVVTYRISLVDQNRLCRLIDPVIFLLMPDHPFQIGNRLFIASFHLCLREHCLDGSIKIAGFLQLCAVLSQNIAVRPPATAAILRLLCIVEYQHILLSARVLVCLLKLNRHLCGDPQQQLIFLLCPESFIYPACQPDHFTRNRHGSCTDCFVKQQVHKPVPVL